PVHTLKVDRSFVSRMGANGENSEIVRTIISLAHNLNLDVIAEGVETAEQRSQLQALGCEFGQGYYFSRPVDAPSASALITS
ncbi:MAG: EAL domain-containing protein, partial [Terriglobia bacterium]